MAVLYFYTSKTKFGGLQYKIMTNLPYEKTKING